MAKVDIGDSTYASFADLDFADEFLFGDVLRATPWALKNEDAKGRGLVSATRTLQRFLTPAAAADTDTPVDAIKEATCLLAADLLARPASVDDASGSSNVKTAKAGSAQVEFFRPVVGATPLPSAIWAMLSAAGVLSAGTSDDDAGPMVSGSDYGCFPAPGARWPYDPSRTYQPRDCDCD